MEYKVLARKYRPKIFKDIVSQSHISRIIENSINHGKLHHAYLLTGIRGVGKTTFARILSKALNCTKDNNNKPTFTPCQKCNHCIFIEKSTHQDVWEIDAASNNGVAHIKEIINNAKYNPISARYKVYVIDEVHMLSNSAFNGLLKILEEPPRYVKFILATTEVKKIPLTILSRCQRFDLHRLNIKELAEYLQNIAVKEFFKIEKGAAILISKAAQGSVRDGLSLLDQAIIISEGNNTIYLNSIITMLGIIKLEYIYELFNSIIKGDIKNTLDNIRELYFKGAEPYIILQELIEISYKITLCKISDPNKIVLCAFELKKCNFIAKQMSALKTTIFWQMFNKALIDVKNSYDDILTLEMTIIKIIHANLIIFPEELLRFFNIKLNVNIDFKFFNNKLKDCIT